MTIAAEILNQFDTNWGSVITFEVSWISSLSMYVNAIVYLQVHTKPKHSKHVITITYEILNKCWTNYPVCYGWCLNKDFFKYLIFFCNCLKPFNYIWYTKFKISLPITYHSKIVHFGGMRKTCLTCIKSDEWKLK